MSSGLHGTPSQGLHNMSMRHTVSANKKAVAPLQFSALQQNVFLMQEIVCSDFVHVQDIQNSNKT